MLTVKFQFSRQPNGEVEAVVFAGSPGYTLANCGTLRMRPDHFQQLFWALQAGADTGMTVTAVEVP